MAERLAGRKRANKGQKKKKPKEEKDILMAQQWKIQVHYEERHKWNKEKENKSNLVPKYQSEDYQGGFGLYEYLTSFHNLYG